MTSNTLPTFRKTKQGQWVAFGPASQVEPGPVQIAKRDGSTKTVEVESVGREFRVDGVACVYGYLAERPRSGSYSTSTSRTRRTGCSCGSHERDGVLVPSSYNCSQCNFDEYDD